MDSGIAPAKAIDLRSLAISSESDSRAAESIRALRTHVMARHVSEGHRALAVCTPSASSGCTFVATNLAVALSQIGVNTLLLDCDLRTPKVARVLKFQSQKADLRAALSTPISFNDCVARDVVPNLSLLVPAGAASNAPELIASGRFKSLIDFCLREFDATIVDTPPANRYSDARRISTVVGYSLIVARRNKTHVNDVKTLAEQIRGDHATVIGTVLNDG